MGYSPTLEHYDSDLANSLQANIAQFSAFKEAAFAQTLKEAMVQEGKLLTWKAFKAQADKVDNLYNKTWLQAEYRQTIANAKSAADFKDYEAQKHLYPNLKYIAVLDERTRTQHRQWNGFTAPVNDPIWKTMLPPNDWGCRCGVEQTDEPISTVRPNTSYIKEAFQNNPALSKEIFPKGGSYKKVLSKEEAEKAEKFAIRKIQKEQQGLTKEWAKKQIPEKEGLTLKAPNFQTGQVCLRRKSIKEIVQHNTDPLIKAYPRQMIEDIQNWKYEGWQEVEKGKHPDTLAFTYYTKEIGGIKRYMNVKVHKDFGEYPYAIADKVHKRVLIKENLPKTVTAQIKK